MQKKEIDDLNDTINGSRQQEETMIWRVSFQMAR